MATEKVLRREFLQQVLEEVKAALMDVEEFGSYREKLMSFEPSAHLPDRVTIYESSDYDTEYRSLKEALNQRHVAYRDFEEKYSSGIRKSSEIDSKDTQGATFYFVNEDTGAHMRFIMLRGPLNLSALVHELLHIFEDYLNLPGGELARFYQFIADRTNIRVD